MDQLQSAIDQVLGGGSAQLDLGSCWLQLEGESLIDGTGFRVLRFRAKVVNAQGIGVAIGCPIFSEAGDFLFHVYFTCADRGGRELLSAYVNELCEIIKAHASLRARLQVPPADFLDAFLSSLSRAEAETFLSQNEWGQREFFRKNSSYLKDKRSLQLSIAGLAQASCAINARTYVNMEALRKNLSACVSACCTRNAELGDLTEEQKRQKALNELAEVVDQLARKSKDVEPLIMVTGRLGSKTIGLLVPDALKQYFELRKQYHYQKQLLTRVSGNDNRF